MEGWWSDWIFYLLPGSLGTGIDSPVIKDSSAFDVPSTTIASTGIFSPGTTCAGKNWLNRGEEGEEEEEEEAVDLDLISFLY